MNDRGIKAYSGLYKLSKHVAVISSIQMLLEWDQETYMPPSGINLRSLQIEYMATLSHQLKTSKKFSKALGSLIDLETGEILAEKLDGAKCAALREWRRDYLKLVKLPGSFVKKFSQVTSQSIQIWGLAKRHNAFRDFAPHLEKIVGLCRKKADYLGFEEHPYDALLDLYEPGMRTHYLIGLFDRLKYSLTTLLKAIKGCPLPFDDFLYGHFDPAKQHHFGHQLLKALGFDDHSSRLDHSTHPFCLGLHPKDTRMTTRIHPGSLMPNILSVIHEGGHGLYNMGLPEEEYGSPLCESISIAIDESQSRMWETIIGHSLPFWKHFFPLLQAQFPEKLKNIHLDEFYRAINVIKPSLIRTDADEITYSLHVIVRFEIEKMLIEGTLKVKEIPEIWQSKMREYLGIAPSNDAEGCLQDIHWSMGGFGYFPTYTLGNLYAAQFFEHFTQTHPNWQEAVEKGNLSVLRNWLHENIHQYGRQFTPHEICMRVTGKTISEDAFIQYLKQKYQKLYQFEIK